MVTEIRPLRGYGELYEGLMVGGSSMAPHQRLLGEVPAPPFCTYIGTSMNPTLCESDVLQIEPYGNRPVRVGDVILFIPPEWNRPVVHRVLRVTPEGFRTRGDSNIGEDPWLVRPSDIIGRVVFSWRGKKRRRISGELVGRLARGQGALVGGASYLLGPIYRALARSGILQSSLPYCLRPRVIVFQTRGSSYLQLLVGRRVVGRYDACRRQWLIQRPFRLFVDEASLPPIHQIPDHCAGKVGA